MLVPTYFGWLHQVQLGIQCWLFEFQDVVCRGIPQKGRFSTNSKLIKPVKQHRASTNSSQPKKHHLGRKQGAVPNLCVRVLFIGLVATGSKPSSPTLWRVIRIHDIHPVPQQLEAGSSRQSATCRRAMERLQFGEFPCDIPIYIPMISHWPMIDRRFRIELNVRYWLIMKSSAGISSGDQPHPWGFDQLLISRPVMIASHRWLLLSWILATTRLSDPLNKGFSESHLVGGDKPS